MDQFCDDPKKYLQSLHTPKNIHFSENQKMLKFKILNSKKITWAYVLWKHQITPTPWGLALLNPGSLNRL